MTSRPLVWKRGKDKSYRGDLHTAGALGAHGQYRVWRDVDGYCSKYFVETRHRVGHGEILEQGIGAADTLEQGKAIAQAHFDGARHRAE
jgi:hypothetical protein